MKVNNKACIRLLAIRQLYAEKMRNLVAILAIALTTLLFTALFTIVISINESVQNETFRQVGGDFHGGFKELTKEQMEALRTDPLIRETGARLFLGLGAKEDFRGNQIEVSYMDENCARHSLISLEEGRLPQETGEAAMDTRVLELLGVKPKLGADIRLTYYMDDNTDKPVLVQRNYTLCGWWQADEVSRAGFVNLSLQEAQELAALSGGEQLSRTGKWDLNVMLGSAVGIEDKLSRILQKQGYQCSEPGKEDYVKIGVNWAYTAASAKLDPITLFLIGILLAIIVLTGYLVIYNVFQISVSQDIRYYGLLKTVGTTRQQLGKIIRMQALLLSVIGIPIGVFLGWFVGVWLTPVIVASMTDVMPKTSAQPVIFLLSALFALFTVLFSCRKPMRMAGKVSPVEAVKYTENTCIRKKQRKAATVSPLSMAVANLGRNRKKTAVTILSLTLAVILLNLSAAFADCFDMDKFLSRFAVTDFLVGSRDYIHVDVNASSKEGFSKEFLRDLQSREEIREGGCTYQQDYRAEGAVNVQNYVEQEHYFKMGLYPLDQREEHLKHIDMTEDGKVANDVTLYGMEPFCIDRLRLLEGDLSKLKETGGNYIAAVYLTDDAGRVREESHWAKLGEKVTLYYVAKKGLYNPETGEAYEDAKGIGVSGLPFRWRPSEYRTKEYEVAALVKIPYSLGQRYYNGSDAYVLNDRTLAEAIGEENMQVLYYAFDLSQPEKSGEMERFLKECQEGGNPELDYENKGMYEKQFAQTKGMFLLLGGVLSLVVGLVGVLNFFNAIFTGIMTRQLEFAMLQSVGMTGRQLKKMLAYEGILYALASGLLSLFLSLFLNPLVKLLAEEVLWFLSYRFTILPVVVVLPIFLLIGTVLPLAVYRRTSRKSIVERLRTE